MEKSVFIFQNVRSIATIETIDSLLHYYNIIDIDVSFSPLIHRYRSINIVIHRKFDILLQPYRPVLFWILFNWTLHLDLTYRETDSVFI